MKKKTKPKNPYQQKQIDVGDILKIRHNNSCHKFEENTLVIVKEVYPMNADFPTRFKVSCRDQWWWVVREDFTLFSKNPIFKNL